MKKVLTESHDLFAKYAEVIALGAPFIPASGLANQEVVVAAITEDAGSRPFIHRYPVPSSPEERRHWIRAALTVRPAGGLPFQLTQEMDRLLQSELHGKIITDALTLRRLTGAYPAASQVSIWNGDIVTLRIGAIVNAANSQMLGCFQPFHTCIDNVIHNAAGPQLREDCARIIALQGHDEPTGDAKITRSYNLPSDYVLHTVGPIVDDHYPTAKHACNLANCYSSCLSLAARAGIKSVAFCGISTGVFGYPADQAVDIALDAVARWLEKNPNTFDHIVFNTYGTAATELYQEAINSWR